MILILSKKKQKVGDINLHEIVELISGQTRIQIQGCLITKHTCGHSGRQDEIFPYCEMWFAPTTFPLGSF